MTPQELRNSILLLAVQGKITKQLPEDGDARDLLSRLCLDKSVRDIEEPFDIPENWLWLPIGSLGETTDTDSFCDGPFGSNLKTIHYISSPEVRIIQLSNIGENGWKDANVKYTSFKHLEEVIPRCEVHPGDLVIAKMMPAGRTIEVPDLGTRITLGSDAMKFVPNKILNKQYLLYAMASQAFLGQVYAEAHGITRVRTTLKGVKSYLLPIPPVAEQERIVARIEELLPLIDRYEKAWSRLEEFNKHFPGDMQKSILQMAIQGKLVDQRPEEGTAEELYRQIQSEKQALIKAGKIKKQKPLPEITEDEIPFDIPESWKWVRLCDVVDVRDGTHDTPKYVSDGIPLVTSKNLVSGSIEFESAKLISFEDANAINIRSGVDDGDILFAMIGTIGNPVLVKKDREFSIKNMALFKKINGNFFSMDYLMLFLTNAQTEMKKSSSASVQSFVSLSFLRAYPIPLPPFPEQKRIVAKLEELLPLCERLK